MRTRMPRQLGPRDTAVFEWVSGRTHTPALNVALPRISRAADHGVLWCGVATALAASGGGRRRAAVRGLLSLAFASSVANVPAKLSIRRDRPPLQGVPVVRQLRRQPTTTSFPSGHAASAAAFATGVAMESPVTGAAVGALAGAVAYSRIYVGVHYPADVLAGVVIGVGCALLTAKRWPRRPAGPARAQSASHKAPALPKGDGLVIVVNAGAGKASRTGIVDELRALLPNAEMVLPGEDYDLSAMMAEVASRAKAIGVAGGDGTVNAAASAALGAGVPLAVFPAGTLDHFARDVGLEEPADTAAAVEAGDAVEVDVGWIEGAPDETAGKIFLNTASLGSYPELVAMRERFEEYIGKWPSAAVAAARILHRGEPVRVEIDHEERRVWLLFAGNGGYRPAGFVPTYRPRLDDGQLDVRILDAVQPWARTRLIAALLSGRLGRCRVYEQRYTDAVSLRCGDGDTMALARDGEVGAQPAELRLRKHPRRLVVYRPVT